MAPTRHPKLSALVGGKKEALSGKHAGARVGPQHSSSGKPQPSARMPGSVNALSQLAAVGALGSVAGSRNDADVPEAEPLKRAVVGRVAKRHDAGSIERCSIVLHCCEMCKSTVSVVIGHSLWVLFFPFSMFRYLRMELQSGIFQQVSAGKSKRGTFMFLICCINSDWPLKSTVCVID